MSTLHWRRIIKQNLVSIWITLELQELREQVIVGYIMHI
jgi:hypothetical protein